MTDEKNTAAINWEQRYLELRFVHEQMQNKYNSLQQSHRTLLDEHQRLETAYLQLCSRRLRPEDPDDYWRITMDDIERRLKIVELQSEILLRNLSHGRTIDYGRFSTACNTLAAPYTDQPTDPDNK